MSKHIYNPIVEQIEEEFFELLDTTPLENIGQIKAMFKTVRSNVMSRYTPQPTPFDVEIPTITDMELAE